MSAIGKFPAISHIRVYPNPAGGFDIHVRHRDGLSLRDTKPTIEEALSVAHGLNGTAQKEPIFVYQRDLETMLKVHGWEQLALTPPRHSATNIGE
ncbi:hypothetical protein [Paracoccus sp. IB05]|uniref:hypothetical protein n=1 Tax=Paracoccus sp. IB05 TaxID=2779367 RepID=UPI0018E7A89A|nr:hypothetical protein [Paracoccus sp. IB05]MBJ2153991.1 hypothetical protein [Paracoccus sp. IB05]